jgi:hypothetical protein
MRGLMPLRQMLEALAERAAKAALEQQPTAARAAAMWMMPTPGRLRQDPADKAAVVVATSKAAQVPLAAAIPLTKRASAMHKLLGKTWATARAVYAKPTTAGRS